MIRTIAILVSLLTALLASVAFAQTQSDRERAMLERLAPIGSVCMSGDACATTAAASAASGPQAPEQIYNSFCLACHMTGIANAPMLGNTEHWAPRIAKGTDVLYQSVYNGIVVEGVQVMPVRGLCMSCSDEELNSVVDYMLDSVR